MEPIQNDRHSADVFKSILWNQNCYILIQISSTVFSKVTNDISKHLGYGLAPSKRWAIIWTNIGTIYWRMNSASVNETYSVSHETCTCFVVHFFIVAISSVPMNLCNLYLRRTSQWTRRVAQSALTYPSGPWVCLRSHNAWYMLKSYYDMNHLILIHCEAEICKRNSEAGGGEPCIAENPCMVLWLTCIAMPLWRHNEFGVTKATQNMHAHMCKWEMFWKVRFVNYASIVFNAINDNSNKKTAQFYKK